MPQFMNLVANLAGPVRRTTLEGREYLVAPCASLGVDVVNGSNGPLFYPEEELSRRVSAWDHKPIVVYHPTLNGAGISACDPVVLETRKIGILLNSVWNGKLRHECWFDVEKTKKVDDRVHNALEKCEMMEVSTGLVVDVEPKEGEYNGKKYTGIARNFCPDHLAILPDQTGAYSIKQGGGLLQLNAEGMSHSAVRMALDSLLRESMPTGQEWNYYIEDVFDSFFVYRQEGKLYSQNYLVSQSKVTLVGSPVEVIQLLTYEPVTANQKKEAEMPKKEMVDALIANKATKWEEKDRTVLMSFSEEQLGKMEPVIVTNNPATAPKSGKKKDEKPADDVDETDTAEMEEGGEGEGDGEGLPKPPTGNAVPVLTTKPRKKKVDSVEEYVANAPPQIREVLNQGITRLNSERKELIEQIISNANCTFTDQYLTTRTIEELRGIAALARSQPQPVGGGNPYYLGAAGSYQTPMVQNVTEEPLVAPTFDYSKKK